MANGNGNGNGNLLRWLGGIFATVVAAAIVATASSSISTNREVAVLVEITRARGVLLDDLSARIRRVEVQTAELEKQLVRMEVRR